MLWQNIWDTMNQTLDLIVVLMYLFVSLICVKLQRFMLSSSRNLKILQNLTWISNSNRTIYFSKSTLLTHFGNTCFVKILQELFFCTWFGKVSESSVNDAREYKSKVQIAQKKWTGQDNESNKINSEHNINRVGNVQHVCKQRSNLLCFSLYRS